MKLQFHQSSPGLADGNYHISAPGSIAASLHWANQDGILENWQPLAFLPLDPGGNGFFRMTGSRSIPAEATHLAARAVSADFSSVQALSIPIPSPAMAPPEKSHMRLLVLTDLHLSRKPQTVRRALSAGANYDAVLITGDLTNDGTPAQLTLFWEILTQTLPHTPVFAVAGNHDYPAFPAPHIFHGICEYHILQTKLLERAADMGWEITRDISGAWAARKEDTALFGLNAAWHWRRFKFPEGAQLDWLRAQLSTSQSRHRLLLCHAPLQNHRPHKPGDDAPYLSMDSRLQEILDSHSGLVFLSGHTHLSLNLPEGCAHRDCRGNVYFNAGSIRPTTWKSDEPLAPEAWVEGNGTALTLSAGELRLQGFSLKTGKNISRACYRFSL